MLDDSAHDAELLRKTLADNSMQMTHVYTPEQALCEINDPAVWIVDVFLDGADGHELSNGFIREHLIPRGLPYCRYTGGASKRTIAGLEGFGVFSKSALRASGINQQYIQVFLKEIRLAGVVLNAPA
jgi:DNA-binding NtrC family response regulator